MALLTASGLASPLLGTAGQVFWDVDDRWPYDNSDDFSQFSVDYVLTFLRHLAAKFPVPNNGIQMYTTDRWVSA